MNLFAERISLQTNQFLNNNTQIAQNLHTIGNNSTKMKDSDKCLDSQLWHACAGSMVQMPSLTSLVYYFPQGHAEHAQSSVDIFSNFPTRVPPFIISRVMSVKFMADPETDEVFAKIRLVPVQQNGLDHFGEDEMINLSAELQEKPASFAKTLTQSDANNGGGFSVPRYCAETIFPRLDYTADPPVQTVLAKDVHGEIWKFRHIYRGTPRRHLLTTGWSTFVNQKQLAAGDSIVFLRTENGDLCVGIRRAKRGIGGGPVEPCGWTPPYNSGTNNSMRSLLKPSNVRSESVVEAIRLASSGQAFDVVYYPRASTPEFCVKAASVREAMRIQWAPGMRFKMPFETEDSSRISWFMGTIASVQVMDSVRWPHSPWRLLQVTWDEPDLLQNVKRVNPWLVELVSTMPAIHLAPFSPPRKKLRMPDFSLESHQFPISPHFSSIPYNYKSSTIAGIQGARHAHYGLSLSDLRLNKLQSGLFHTGSTIFNPASTFFVSNPRVNINDDDGDDISCMLTIGTPATTTLCDAKKPSAKFVLFGQTILTEEQISLSSSGNSLSSGNVIEKGANLSSSDVSGD